MPIDPIDVAVKFGVVWGLVTALILLLIAMFIYYNREGAKHHERYIELYERSLLATEHSTAALNKVIYSIQVYTKVMQGRIK